MRSRRVERFDPIRAVIGLVARDYGVRIKDILHPTRAAPRIAFARQVAMYLAHTALGRPQSEVATLFRRDRSTLAHACALVEDKRDDPEFEARMARLEAALAAAPNHPPHFSMESILETTTETPAAGRRKKSGPPAHDPETGEVFDEATLPAGEDELDADDEAELEPLPDLNLDTLTGDLRDAMLMRLRTMPKPFTVMSEREQKDLIYGVDAAASHLVMQAVRLIAANGMPSLRCSLDSINFKDGAKLVLKASKHDEDLLGFMHELIDRTGSVFILTITNPGNFHGERAPAKAEPDQRALPIENGEGGNVAAFKGKDVPVEGAPA